MLSNISIFLSYWVGCGMIIHFLQVWIYFRGPKHTIDCYVQNEHTKKHGIRIKDSCNGAYYQYALAHFIHCILLPPLAFLDFFIDFIVFSLMKPTKKSSS